MQEGMTATNPQTGEKVVLRGGQWVPAGSAAPRSAPRPSSPAFVPGVKQADPMEVRRLELAERGAERADRADQRSADAAERSAERAAQELARTRETEDKAAAFLTRALGSNTSYEAQGIGPRGYVGQKLKDAAPDLLNQLPAWMGNSPQRQVADSAQDEFIAATLRQDSGAAIPEQELERQRRIYFPQPGDSEEAIAQKRAARLRAIAGLERSSGRALRPEQKKLLDQSRADIDAAVAGAAVEGGKVGVPLSPSAVVDQLLAKEPNKPVMLPDGGVEVLEDDGTTSFWSSRAGYERTMAEDRLARTYGDGTDAFYEAYRREFGEWPPLAESYLHQPGAQRDRQAENAIDKKREDEIADPIVRGIADTVTLGLADELEAGRKTLFDSGTMRDNLAAQRDIDHSDERVNPLLRGGGQFAGALLPWGRVVGRGGAGGQSIGRMAGEGAGLGGAYAFGSAEGDLTDRLKAVPGGATIGALAGGGLGALAKRMGRTPPGGGGPAPASRRDIAEAARDTGVDILPADVGGPVTRGVTGAARQMFLSELPIANKVGKAVEQAADFRGRTAATVGRALDKDDAGELTRKAANIYAKETGRQGSALYTRAEELASGARVTPTKALAKLDEQIAELSETPAGSALLDELKTLRNSLANGTFTIRGVRNMRTRLREEADFRGLRGGDTDRRLKSVVEAASEDILDSLAESGNERAAQAFRTADDFWRKRVETIDQVLEPLLGKNAPRSGEQVLGALERMASRETGDAARLQRLMAALPAEEASGVRATIINRLGQPANAEQGAFSFNDFVKRWDGMSTKAKETLFPGDARKALDKLATVAREAKATAAYSNSSNTGRAIGGQALFSTIVGSSAGAASAASIAPALVAAGAGQYALGKLLTSKLFVNLLARAPKGDMKTFTQGLSNVAKRDPALAQDALGLQRFLEQTFAQTPLRAAASADDEKK